jgi:hypothetical protein
MLRDAWILASGTFTFACRLAMMYQGMGLYGIVRNGGGDFFFHARGCLEEGCQQVGCHNKLGRVDADLEGPVRL